MKIQEIVKFAESLGLGYKTDQDDYYFYLPDGMVDFDNQTDDPSKPIFFVWRSYSKEVVLTKTIDVDENFNITFNDSYTTEDMEVVKHNVTHLYGIAKTLNDNRKKFKENTNLLTLKGDFT